MAHSPSKKDKSPQSTCTTKDTHSVRALLAHAWLFPGKWFGRLLLLLLAVGPGGWAIGNLYYTWKFSDPVSIEEQIAPDEARITQAVIQDATHVVRQHHDNTRTLRDARTRTHGRVKAEFRVRTDPDPTLRRGVFAKADKSWDTWVHFSNDDAYSQFDNRSDACGMTIKLLDVPGEKLLPDRNHDDEQDFVMFNQPMFFIRDVAEYRQNFAIQVDDKKILAFSPSWDPTSWGLHHLPITLRTLAPAPDSPLHADYNGTSPHELGEYNIKFRIAPAPEERPVYQLPRQNQDLPNSLRATLYQRLSIDHIPACYAFQVQCQGPGKYMPIEGTNVEWKESGAPLAIIADIIVPTQDFDSRGQNLFYGNLSLSPWHTLLEHRPIDRINRLRETVYETASGYRLGGNG